MDFQLFSNENNIFITFCLMLGIIILFLEYKKRTSYRRISSKLPTIYGLPLVGYLYKWIPLTKFFTSFDQSFEKVKSKTFFTFFAAKPMIVTIDPEIVKHILSSEHFLTKARSLYDAIDRAIPNGLITTNGEKWKNNRKLLNSSFNANILISFMSTFNQGAQRTCNELQILSGKGEQPIFDVIKRAILHIAFETTLGIDIKSGNASDEQLVKDFNYIIAKVSDDAVFSSLNLGFLVRTPKYYKTIKAFRDHIRKTLQQEILGTEELAQQTQLIADNNFRKSCQIFIYQALDFQRRGLFQEHNVISETLTMLAGTFETVSTTMYSLLVLLAMHPDIQEKLFEEVIMILPEKNTTVEIDDLKKMSYADMVIDETLRLMPSIPFVGREISEETWLNEDIFMAKDVQVAIPVFNLHRCKDIWGPNANTFDPDNFLAENINEKHPYAYIPFSKGLRNCLGWRYAKIVLRVLTLHLVRNFKYSTSFKYENLVFVQKLSIRYEKEPLLNIQERLK